LDWPASSYAGSGAMDSQNIFGINSSKRTRKTGDAAGGGGGGGEEAAKASGSAASGANSEVNEPLSLSEGLEVILSHLSNLCNHVTQKASLQSLRAMKAAPLHAHLFTQPLLLFETYKLLAAYSYKLPARRFLFFDLFGSVQFNVQSIAQFDAPFHEEGYSSANKQRIREQAAAAAGQLAAAASSAPPTAAAVVATSRT